MYLFSLKIGFVTANNVDPDKILHNVAIHLGLYCLPKNVFRSHYMKYTKCSYVCAAFSIARNPIFNTTSPIVFTKSIGLADCEGLHKL